MKSALLFSLLLCAASGLASAADSKAFLDAAESNDIEKVRKLIQEGADVNATTRHGETALHYAAWNENIALIELLLDSGGTPSLDIREKQHKGTPLEWVTFKGRPAVVKLLLDRGSKVYDLDWKLATKFATEGPPRFLRETKKEDYVLILEHFKAAKFNDRQDLFSACERADMEMAKRVLAANPEALQERTEAGDEFGEGLTPVLFAASGPSHQILDLIIAAGAPLDAVDPEGNTVLHKAAAAGAWQNLKPLLAKGVPIDGKNKAGKTPLELAVENKKLLIVELLLQAGAPVTEELKSAKTTPQIAAALQGGQTRIVLAPTLVP